MVGEGEGRNAVYAAKTGWQVDAMDLSYTARDKALSLAKLNKVSINYQIADFFCYNFPRENYDAIGIIFVHTNETENDSFYKNCENALRRDGRIILELFSHNQIGKNSGGPQNLSMLCSIDKIKKGFSTLKHELLKEENIILSEGEFHQGEASVIRYVGVK
jgi:cyclopropane fatty-acyl-phospholipid synthase-like methyltransferase